MNRGFSSAKMALIDLGFSEYDLYRRQLLSLPTADRHLHDKEMSAHEAYEEIRLSKNYLGSKGFSTDHYKLGHDNKRVYGIYRIGEKLFSLRTHKKV
jgi:hypothetical protein